MVTGSVHATVEGVCILKKLPLIALNLLLIISFHGQLPARAATLTPQEQTPVVATTPTDLLLDQLIIKFTATPAAMTDTTPSASQVAVAQADAAAVSAQLQTLSTLAGVTLQYERAMSDAAYVLKLPEPMAPTQVERIAATLRADAATRGIAYVEPDYRRQAQLTPNDAAYGEQWNLGSTYGINAANAWNVTTGSSAVVVAVLDTGIRTDHPDLAGRTVGGYDFVSDRRIANDGNSRDSDPSDPGDWITAAEASAGYFRGCGVSDSSWHGSHVAGILGAAGNNGVGIAGVTWNNLILPLRVLGKCGGTVSDIVDAMRWAAGIDVSGVPHNEHPARVINLSLAGSGSCSAAEQSAINDVISRGVVVVVAAGNSNQNAANASPGNCSGVINVAATARSGDKASYSNYGTVVTVSAPGGDSDDAILSTVDLGAQGPAGPGYADYAGTSMASPHVAGVVALMLAKNSSLTPTQVRQLLRAAVTQFPSGSSCNTNRCGAGIVNALAAVNAAAASIAATPTPTRTPTRAPTATPTRKLTPTPTFTPTATIDYNLPMTNTHYLPLIQRAKP